VRAAVSLFDDAAAATEFIITVVPAPGAPPQVVNRRYSAFYSFYKEVRAEFPGIEFPAKTWLPVTQHADLEKRREQLDTFLCTVLESYGTSEFVRRKTNEFLGLPCTEGAMEADSTPVEHEEGPSDTVRAWLDSWRAKNREHSLISLINGLDTGGWANSELQALESDGVEGHVRVAVFRHGMGFHNDSTLVPHSPISRDAELNETGVQQCQLMGEFLKRGDPCVLNRVKLVIVSPFRRTMQSCLHTLGEDFLFRGDRSTWSSWLLGGSPPTVIVHPLAAEHTFRRSMVMQGDRGSTVEELQTQPQFAPFDLSPVSTYCQDKGCLQGRWWRHGPAAYEDGPSFSARAAEFKRFVAATAAEKGLGYAPSETLSRGTDLRTSCSCSHTAA